MGFIKKNKVIQNISWLIFDKIFVMVIGLIVIVRIANHFGPKIYGIYEYAISINFIIGIIILFVDGRVVKKRYQGKNDGHIIYNTTIAKVSLSLLAFFTGLIVIILLNRDSSFNLVFLLILFNNILINLGFGLQNYFEYQLKSKQVVIASNIATLVSSIMQLIAVTLNFSIVSIVTIIVFSSIVKLVILCIQFRKSYNLLSTTHIDKPLVYAIIRESAPLAIAAAAATIYQKVDQVMIGAMLGVAEVGVYAISIKLISVVTIAIGPLQISIFPKMIEWYDSNKEKYYERYLLITSFCTWLYIAGTLFSLWVIPTIFDLFFNDEYIQSTEIFRIHVLGAFFMYNAILRSSHFTLTKKTYVMLISQIIAVLINISLNYLLIPTMGVRGAALATVITQLLSLLLLDALFKDGKEVFYLQLKGVSPIYLVRWAKKKI